MRDNDIDDAYKLDFVLDPYPLSFCTFYIYSAAIDGNWGLWSEFNKCSLTCGEGGINSRVRVCSNPAPAYGGHYCENPKTDTDIVSCVTDKCGM